MRIYLKCICIIDIDRFDILATDVSKSNLLVKPSLLIKPGNPNNRVRIIRLVFGSLFPDLRQFLLF